jgi:hypothetical protein
MIPIKNPRNLRIGSSASVGSRSGGTNVRSSFTSPRINTRQKVRM